MVALVFVLGLKHGFDPDHLVAIDGMTRSTKSRWCGLFFSLGHGVVVTLVGVAVALAVTEWQAPAWLEQTGALISIGVLLTLGLANLLAVLRTPAGRRVAPIGLRGRWLAERLAGASHPAVIASVGAAFAVSFDTVSHALLWSASGLGFAAALGLIFTLGMVATDVVNGLWVAKMISQADHRAAAASRWMSGAIALLCLALAVGNFIAHAVPAPVISVATFVVILAACVLASRSAYREAGS
jgi:high-affinity nickel-transport protein